MSTHVIDWELSSNEDTLALLSTSTASVLSPLLSALQRVQRELQLYLDFL
jgi:hypothetical protein